MSRQEPCEAEIGEAKAGIAPHLAMLAFVFLISSSFTVGQSITPHLDPAALTFSRFVLSIPIIFMLAKWQGLALAKPTSAQMFGYGWLAFLVVIYFVAMFEALRLTDSISTSAIFTLTPLITLVFSTLFLNQRLTPAAILAMLISACGAIFVMFGGDFRRIAALSLGWGEVIFFVGAFFYALYAPSVRFLFAGGNPTILTFWLLIAGSLLLGIYGWRAILSTHWFAVPGFVYLGVLHLALFCTAASNLLIQYASIRLPAAKVMAYTYLIPAFVLLQNAALGDGLPALSILAGVGVIGVATLMLQTSR